MSRGSTQKDEGSPIDWIKIKSKHILFTDLSDSEVGILVRIQLLTALHERLLLRPEIEKHFHKRWLVSLEYKLSNIGVSIEYVMSKVLEDVEYVQSKRDAGKQRVRKYRADKECNALPERACNEAEKIREDKRREDSTPISPLAENYKTKDGELWQCSNEVQLLAFVKNNKEIPESDKKDLTIQIQSSFKNKSYEICDVHFLIDSFKKQKIEEMEGMY